jgi:hypothetical protein
MMGALPPPCYPLQSFEFDQWPEDVVPITQSRVKATRPVSADNVPGEIAMAYDDQ